MKTLGSYLCWTQTFVEGISLNTLICYLEPGEAELVRNQTKRMLEIVTDMIKQDREVQIVVCGDFNKQLPHIAKELRKDGFTSAF